MAIVYGCQCHHVCFHYYSGQLQIHNSIHLLYKRLIIIDHHHLHSTEKGGHSLEVWTFSDFTQLSRCIAAILYGTPIIDSVNFAKFLFFIETFFFFYFHLFSSSPPDFKFRPVLTTRIEKKREEKGTRLKILFVS